MKIIEQNEAKMSRLREDLTNTKEALNKTCLEKDVLSHEKNEISQYFYINYKAGLLIFLFQVKG